MKNFVQDGSRIEITASADISSGDLVVVGSRVAVACVDIAAGATGAAAAEGVFTLPKKSTDVIAQGAPVYWDADPGEITTTATDNTLAGYAFVAADNGTITVQIKINS